MSWIQKKMAFQEYVTFLKSTRREFWGIQALVFFSSGGYYLIMYMMGIYLHREIGLSRVETGFTLGAFATSIAGISFVCGAIVDRIGFRNGMLLGALASTIGRVGLGLLPFLDVVDWDVRPFLLLALLLTGIGEGFLQPTAAAGTARFSPTEKRGKAFIVQTVMFQLGGGFLVALIVGLTWANGEPLYPLYFIAAALALPVPLVAFFMMKDESPAERPSLAQKVVKRLSWWKLVGGIFREKEFWITILLLMILLGPRMGFGLQGPLYNPYYQSVLGEKLDLGLLLLINPGIIVVGLIISEFSEKRKLSEMSPYTRLTLGMSLIASSVLFLAIPPHLLGMDISRAYFVMAVVQLAVFAIGELFQGPAFRQYLISFAPPEKLTSYAGAFSLTNIPSRFLPAVISGFLLAKYCPEGVRERIQTETIPYLESPQMIFVIWGFIMMTGPILLIAFRKWFAKQENQKEKEKNKRQRRKERKLRRKKK